MRVLICEDDEGIVEVVSIALTTGGHFPIPCQDHADIDRLVETESPDIILLDLWLRGQNGEEVLERLKRTRGDKIPRIILMSANGKLTEVAERHGVDYIMKPFGLEELNEVIRRNME